MLRETRTTLQPGLYQVQTHPIIFRGPPTYDLRHKCAMAIDGQLVLLIKYGENKERLGYQFARTYTVLFEGEHLFMAPIDAEHLTLIETTTS